ncbi:MAG: hypothetical protein J6A15_00990 [Clostridia bacterium]|nr:hypothetical protein [Clostridia bacterium]
MKESYYIFDNEGEVMAIFRDEAFAIDYLNYLGLSEENCSIGVLSESVFNFENHNIKYHLKDPSLIQYMHKDCRRFRSVNKDMGYCFYTDEQVEPYEKCCTAIERK